MVSASETLHTAENLLPSSSSLSPLPPFPHSPSSLSPFSHPSFPPPPHPISSPSTTTHPTPNLINPSQILDPVGDVWKAEWYPAHCYKIPSLCALNSLLSMIAAAPTSVKIRGAADDERELQRLGDALSEIVFSSETCQKQIVFFLQNVTSTANALQRQLNRCLDSTRKNPGSESRSSGKSGSLKNSDSEILGSGNSAKPNSESVGSSFANSRLGSTATSDASPQVATPKYKWFSWRRSEFGPGSPNRGAPGALISSGVSPIIPSLLTEQPSPPSSRDKSAERPKGGSLVLGSINGGKQLIDVYLPMKLRSRSMNTTRGAQLEKSLASAIEDLATNCFGSPIVTPLNTTVEGDSPDCKTSAGDAAGQQPQKFKRAKSYGSGRVFSTGEVPSRSPSPLPAAGSAFIPADSSLDVEKRQRSGNSKSSAKFFFKSRSQRFQRSASRRFDGSESSSGLSEAESAPGGTAGGRYVDAGSATPASVTSAARSPLAQVGRSVVADFSRSPSISRVTEEDEESDEREESNSYAGSVTRSRPATPPPTAFSRLKESILSRTRSSRAASPSLTPPEEGTETRLATTPGRVAGRSSLDGTASAIPSAAKSEKSRPSDIGPEQNSGAERFDLRANAVWKDESGSFGSASFRSSHDSSEAPRTSFQSTPSPANPSSAASSPASLSNLKPARTFKFASPAGAGVSLSASASFSRSRSIRERERAHPSDHEKLQQIMRAMKVDWSPTPAFGPGGAAHSGSVFGGGSALSSPGLSPLSATPKSNSGRDESISGYPGGGSSAGGFLAAGGSSMKVPSPAKKRHEELILGLLKATPPIKWDVRAEGARTAGRSGGPSEGEDSTTQLGGKVAAVGKNGEAKGGGGVGALSSSGKMGFMSNFPMRGKQASRTTSGKRLGMGTGFISSIQRSCSSSSEGEE